MEVARPEFRPDPSLSREEMERLQHEIARAAVFADDLRVDASSVWVASGPEAADSSASTGESIAGGGERQGDGSPLVAGVDQAFLDDRAVSVVVVLQDGEIVERAHAVEPTEYPYVPGLLSFREAGPVLAAFAELTCEPDLVLVDGSGRIHYREAGLATHLGLLLALPTVGVAKSLLCGTPRDFLDRQLPTGARIAVEADDEVTADPGTVIGYAVQTRQFEGANRHVNPLFVSPGHRVSADTAADLVLQCAGGYKLPEPTRLADRDADEVKDGLT
jgi:deoxyribonuclease V